MEMTYEQRQDYNKLTASQKMDFSYEESKHPNWSFQQIMAKIAMAGDVIIILEKGGNNVDPADPTTWLTILEGVKTTLSKFKSIGQSIFIAINSAIVSLKGLVIAGAKKVGNVIENLLDKIL